MNETYVDYDKSNEPMSVHPSIIDRFKKEKNTDALIAMYMLYYHTARWQETNRVKANDTYIRKCLSWGADKTRKTKRMLIEMGLIEKHSTRNEDGTIKEWYIKVKFMFNHMSDKSVVGNKNTCNPQVDETTSGLQATNALSLNNQNALSLNKKYISTPKELPTICFDIADLLISFVKEQTGQDKTRSRRKWAEIIDKMDRIDKLELDYVYRGVHWYVTLGDYPQICPVIHSAQSLRDKWGKLINYSKKLAKESNQVHSVNQQVMSDIALLQKINKPN